MRRLASEDGAEILVAIMALLLMTAIGGALVLTSSSETLIAAHFRDNFEARAAADAMMQRGIDDVAAVGDWTLLTSGALRSSWVDGVPGARTLTDSSILDLSQVVNIADCAKTTACSIAEMSTVTADRPWGANNPQWVLYAYGPLTRLLPASATIDSPFYVVLLVGAAVPPADWSTIGLRAEAFGPHGAHAVVEATAGRPASSGQTTVLSWRDLR